MFVVASLLDRYPSGLEFAGPPKSNHMSSRISSFHPGERSKTRYEKRPDQSESPDSSRRLRWD